MKIPATEVNGKVKRYQLGTTLMEPNISKVLQSKVNTRNAMRCFLGAEPAMVSVIIQPNQEETTETR